MSRIGKLPVAIPANVELTLKDNQVSVKGPKGSVIKEFNTSVDLKVEEGQLTVAPANNSKLAKAMHGTARSIINNMVKGVVDGFSKDLEIHGVGFRAALKGKILDLSLGYSHPIEHEIPEGITVTVAENTKIKVEGADKQLVGAVAASIKAYYPVEPYKGKGVRIVGEFVRRKEGKKTA